MFFFENFQDCGKSDLGGNQIFWNWLESESTKSRTFMFECSRISKCSKVWMFKCSLIFEHWNVRFSDDSITDVWCSHRIPLLGCSMLQCSWIFLLNPCSLVHMFDLCSPKLFNVRWPVLMRVRKWLLQSLKFKPME